MEKWLASGYTVEGKPDMVLLAFDSERGLVKQMACTHLGSQPSFLLKAGERYYVAFEVHDPQTAAVVAEVYVSDNSIALGRKVEIPGAYGLCHLAADSDALYGSCWASGHVFCVDQELEYVRWCVKNGDGTGKTPHAHWSVVGADGLLYCADVGLDKLFVYDRIHGALVRSAPMMEGAAPRQILVRQDGKQFYVVNENQPSFHLVDADTLEILQTFDLPPENYPGGACITKDDMLLIPNRGPDTISVFDVRQAVPQPMQQVPCGGAFPRMVCAGRGGKSVLSLNQRGNNVQFFHFVDGRLTSCAKIELAGASSAIQLE